jgi:hypothetical protein
MSVSFYDPENMIKYDEDYNVVGGGPEANFANTNARMILDVLGLETDPSLYGEVSAEDMIVAIERGIVGVSNFCGEDDYKVYLLRSFQALKEVAEASMNHSKKVCWG